jgi:hypothetical protein
MRSEEWMHRYIICLVLPLFSACDLFEDVKDTFDGLTDPLVVQSVVMGVEAAGVDPAVLDEIDLDAGVGATVFLANAKSATDLENAPITGAVVSINNTEVPETGNGSYTLEPGKLSYSVGATWNMTATIGTDLSEASFTLPPAPNATIPSIHTANQPLTISLAGQNFDLVVGLVALVDSGDITWSNEPEDIRDVYELASGSAADSLEIPGTAFPSSGAYVVGVAGMSKSKADQLQDMNTALSNIVAGKMKLYPMVVP